MGLLDQVQNNKKPSGSLKEAIENDNPSVSNDKPKEKKVKVEKENVSYTIDKKRNVDLTKYVLEQNLKNIGKKGVRKLSASGIVNELIGEFLKENA